MALKGFLDILNESVSKKGFAQYAETMLKYFDKKLGGVSRLHGVEYFRSGSEQAFGYLYLVHTGKAFRVNWVEGSTDSNKISSVDFWNSKSGTESEINNPDYRLELGGEDVSAAKLLPAIVQTVLHPTLGEFSVKADTEVEATKEMVKEAKEEPKEKETKFNLKVASVQTIGIPEEGKVEYKEKSPLKEQLEIMVELVGVVAHRTAPSLIVGGAPGIGKSFLVEKKLTEVLGAKGTPNKPAKWSSLSGSISAVGVYKYLYENNGTVIVFDDIDEAFSSEEGRNILKGALDTKQVRTISWIKESNMVYSVKKVTDPAEQKRLEMKGMVPNQFSFNGSVIAITNKSLKSIDPDGAISSRSLYMDIQTKPEDVIGYMEEILPFLKIDLTNDDGSIIQNYTPPDWIKDDVMSLIKKSGDPRNLTLRKLVRSLALYSKEWNRMDEKMLHTLIQRFT